MECGCNSFSSQSCIRETLLVTLHFRKCFGFTSTFFGFSSTFLRKMLNRWSAAPACSQGVVLARASGDKELEAYALWGEPGPNADWALESL